MDTHPLKAFRDRQTPTLSQKGLAELIGVARETVARWESGARRVDDELLPVVVERTGIPATELRPDLVKLLAATETTETAA
jgi:transcriptional regulator with XRE-family HTH domain